MQLLRTFEQTHLLLPVCVGPVWGTGIDLSCSCDCGSAGTARTGVSSALKHGTGCHCHYETESQTPDLSSEARAVHGSHCRFLFLMESTLKCHQ